MSLSPKQEQLFKQASKHIPGGVNSPVRAFNGVGGCFEAVYFLGVICIAVGESFPRHIEVLSRQHFCAHAGPVRESMV